jgi:HEAT repeat protein
MLTNDELVKEIKKTGLIIKDIYDLVNSKKPYPLAIPILLRALEQGIEDKALKEGVIRALAVKEAKGKGGILLEEFKKIPKNDMILLWTIGNTIEVIISENDVDDVITIVKNKENGMSRKMFVLALGKIKLDKVERLLIDLLDDNVVSSHAIAALGKLKSQKAKSKIALMINDKNLLIRKEAQKALKKITK